MLALTIDWKVVEWNKTITVSPVASAADAASSEHMARRLIAFCRLTTALEGIPAWHLGDVWAMFVERTPPVGFAGRELHDAIGEIVFKRHGETEGADALHALVCLAREPFSELWHSALGEHSSASKLGFHVDAPRAPTPAPAWDNTQPAMIRSVSVEFRRSFEGGSGDPGGEARGRSFST